jgi:gliding motility-associated-like protein
MKNNNRNIILTLFCLISYSGYSQINCTVPLPPLFSNVSVQPETGYTDLSWELSQSTDIAAYILYTYENGNGMAFDTLWDPTVTHYTVTNTAPKYLSTSYVVAAFRLPIISGMDGCPSPLSNVLNTIFTEASIDTCNRKITISWNKYISYPKEVTDYSVLMSVNGGAFTEAAKVSADKNSYIMNDFVTDADYCFIIRANLLGGTYSTSNKVCIVTLMQRPPLWINADYATVNSDKTISLAFTIDPFSEITHFNLERKSRLSGSFEVIKTLVSTSESILYTDDKADINTINYYRLSAINNCNNPVTVSNLSSNIVLSLEEHDNVLKLSWNTYAQWNGGVSSYRLFINTGREFEEKIVFQPDDTTFSLGYKVLMYDVTGNEVCFYITASEISNPNSAPGTSNSNTACIIPTEIITVPNVFTPNNDLVNDFFKPVLSFTPVNYHFIISDRQGYTIFETRDHLAAWDGSQQGNSTNQGVFLWFLKVTTPSGKIISKTGTITIFKNR